MVVITRKGGGGYRVAGKWFMAREQALRAAAKELRVRTIQIEETFDVLTDTATIIVRSGTKLT